MDRVRDHSIRHRRPSTPTSAAILCAAVLAGSALLAIQGWRARLPGADDVIPILDSLALRDHATIPSRGTLSSFGALIPPGTTWLWSLGAMVVHEPRLLQYPGALLLFAGTALGIFLLARIYLEPWFACGAVTMYAFSNLGIFFASSLWPRGHPFFAVWCVYFLSLWVLRRSPWWLTLALITYAAGMYYFMEIAPLGIVFAVVWIYCRQSLKILPLCIALAVTALIWEPYLEMDANQGFRNVKALILRRSLIDPVSPAVRWCDPSLTLRRLDVQDHRPVFSYATGYHEEIEKIPRNPIVRILKWLAKEYLKIVDGALANFVATLMLPGLAGVLLAVWLLSTSTLFRSAKWVESLMWRSRSSTVVLVACIAITLPLNAYTLLVARSNPGFAPESGRTLIRSSFEIIVCAVLLVALGPRTRHITAARKTADDRDRVHVLLAITIAVLSAIVVAERGHTNRLWWSWPLQIVVLLSFFSGPNGVVGRRGPIWCLTLILGCCINTMVVGRFQSWFRDGFTGQSTDQVRMLDYLGARLRHAGGSSEARIGYIQPFQIWLPPHSQISPLYKVGMESDLYLRLKYGVVNGVTCAEGVSREDDFRIVKVLLRRHANVDELYLDLPPLGFVKDLCYDDRCLFRAGQ